MNEGIRQMKWIPLCERKPDFKKGDGLYLFLLDFSIEKTTTYCNYIPDCATHFLEFDFPPLPKQECKDKDLKKLKDDLHDWKMGDGRDADLFESIVSFLEKKFGEK